MPGRSRTLDELERGTDCAQRLRARAPLVVEQSMPALQALVLPYRRLTDDDLRRALLEYLDALARAMGTGEITPLAAFLDTLSAWWPAGELRLDQAMRGFFLIGDVLQTVLRDDGEPDSSPLVERWTRETVALFANRTLAAVSSRLEGQVERHRVGEERLLSLQRVSAAVVSDLDLDRTLTVIVEEACRLMDAGAAAIRLVTEDGQHLRLIASAGLVTSLLLGDLLPVEGSLGGHCFRSGQPVLTNEVSVDARLSPELKLASGLRAVLIVPLMVRDRPIGVLLVGAAEPGSYSSQDQTLLGLFADQAASAIENARLYQQAQQQIAELAVLQRISSVISSSLDLETVFRAIYEEIRGVMPADAFVIARARDDERYDLDFIVDGGERFPPLSGSPLSPGLEATVRERRAVVIGDLQEDGAPELQTVSGAETPVRSVIAAPLLKGTEVVGILSAQSYQPHRYRDSDARLLMTIANHAVVAIDHARLYQQAQSLAVAEERNRLAREIHDTLAQGLIGIILSLERIDTALPADDAALRPLVQRTLVLARTNLDEARRSVRDLRAAPLDGRTLVEALTSLVEEVGHEGGPPVRLSVEGTIPPLGARIEAALFRMAQEATTNCRKHAECGRINLRLAVVGNTLTLEVADDGKGFDVGRARRAAQRFGLLTMRERVTQAGGTFAIKSAPGKGTVVRARVPLDRIALVDLRRTP
ncbi:MAG TPA: GAF domain-containing sensor histidine kinase [Thermomicrobiaceae bacterium]|nr:GAF domain-containing sensor histidine kinase [Thermomicrobiaceae bacterium]